MVYVIIAAMLIPLIIGFLLGMMRGSRRAMLRLILVVLCLVAAFCLKGVITDMVMQLDIDGQTAEQYIVSQLPEELASLGDLIMPIVTLIVMAVVFLVLFFGIKFVSWLIIFPICKIFVKKARKKEDGSYGNKHPLIGGIVGLVQGAAVALVLCVMLNGLFYNMANVVEAVGTDDLQGDSSYAMAVYADSEGPAASIDESGGNQPLASVDVTKMLAEYKKSNVCQMINSTGGVKIFDAVVTIKTEDDRQLTLTGQLDALSGLVKMAKELAAIGNMEMKGGLSGDVATDITSIFNKLDDICNALSDESKQTMNDIVKVVADNFLPEGTGFDLTILNFETVNFKNEGQVIAELSSYKEEDFANLTQEQAKDKAKEIVNTVMESDIILPLLSSNDDFTIGLNDEQQAFAKDVIDDLASAPEADQNKIDMLRKFFGINN